MKYKIITPVVDEPLTLDEVKLHLHMTSETTEDSWVFSKITAAREYCEEYTGRALATQTIELYLDSFDDDITLPRSPLQSVTSIKYKNSAAVETTMTVNTDYLVDTDSNPGRIVLAYGKSWPSFTEYPVNPIKVTFIAGYTAIPESIKQAMLLLIGHWYENREASLIGTITTEIKFAVRALLDQYRNRWF